MTRLAGSTHSSTSEERAAGDDGAESAINFSCSTSCTYYDDLRMAQSASSESDPGHGCDELKGPNTPAGNAEDHPTDPAIHYGVYMEPHI